MRLAVDDRERQRIVNRRSLLEPGHELALAREGSVGQVVPGRVGSGARRVQLLAVARDVERLQQHAVPRERRALRSFGRAPRTGAHWVLILPAVARTPPA